MFASLLLGCTAPPAITGDERVETFYSAGVDDDYVLRLRLPPDDAVGPFPLVVQLDPTYAHLEEYARTAGLVSAHAADGDWPEAVVLGVDYPDPWTRHRDYALPEEPDPAFAGGGADTFFAVLRDEVLPYVEADLDVDPSRRVLVGHSNGGVFTTYAALRYDPDTPRVFAGFVSADFGVDRQMFTYLDWLLARTDDLPVRWYGSRAVFNGATQQITHDALWGRLQDAQLPSLALQVEVLETDHGGAVTPSFEHGLDFVLADGGL